MERKRVMLLEASAGRKTVDTREHLEPRQTVDTREMLTSSAGRKTVDTREKTVDTRELLTLHIIVNLQNHLISTSPSPKNSKKAPITRSLWLSRFWTWYNGRNKGGMEGRSNQMRDLLMR